MQLPGSSFVHPDAELRQALTAAAARQVTRMTGNGMNGCRWQNV